VSLFYFRAGYTEKDYIDEDSWKGREMIELSTAIKCPNMNTFLCTFKIFQYHLQKPEILKKYLGDELIINDLLRFFTKIYFAQDMDEPSRKNLFTEVLKDVKKFIIKPQKEGGGNNFYNEDILQLIPNADVEMNETLKTSIIMERVFPPEIETTILFENKPKVSTCVSEASVYGIILSDDRTIHINKSVGFLLRTKEATSEEGGVIVGASAIDIPCLVDMKLDNSLSEPIHYVE
jgi:glutathione synthase